MNEIKIFGNAEFGEIRTIIMNNEPWFVGKDVAEILGYERITKATVDHVDDDDRIMIDSETQSYFGIELGQRGGWLINESGLYSLIFSSKLESARRFKRWVTSEVLPSIRKTGSYIVNECATKSIPVGEIARLISRIDTIAKDKGNTGYERAIITADLCAKFGLPLHEYFTKNTRKKPPELVMDWHE